MFKNAWPSLVSIGLNIEARIVLLLGTRLCLLCDQSITPTALSLKPIYQSRFLCQICIAQLRSDMPIVVTLNLAHEAKFSQKTEISQEIECLSICPYQGVVREAIRAFKYQDKQELANDLAHLLEFGLVQIKDRIENQNLIKNRQPVQQKNTLLKDRRLKDSLLKNTLLIAVPLHQSKLEERGFNQSELITRALAKRAKIKCDNKSLTRCKATAPQYGLSKIERAINVNQAFFASEKVAGKNIVLVDDVLTSGATALACAQALVKAGAKSVSVLTVARALLRSETETKERTKEVT